ncbi:RNA:NAD 2'-phosphotransferase (TPT1/KptA family) [Roseimicrobium gellanilyticum]|uniref:Probable RNA 2'-phosphotransferase n=1 Tax=Roseimicrobium gellanilyticum TaxID=748857 RepID=A0A366H9J9_9BACT|nr:RNA 2'-phosphotransferase [Roseimicrobium gellanilyticum]RBP38103.1 RNA:NAD 2'-phosphotransferase (TPT1/KptA family) [Roseimicrobium gellanilyticum]
MRALIVKTSKFLSRVLRHRPEDIGLELDGTGWADVDELITCASLRGNDLSRDLLARVVAEDDKRRFALSDDGSKIRAVQGHSVAIDLGLSHTQPPNLLYHGTATHRIASIRAEGLRPGSRRHVHLSNDEAAAVEVGKRHGEPVALTVRSAEMAAKGHLFFRSDNGVWLTDAVPPGFIEIPTAATESIDVIPELQSCGFLVFRRTPQLAFLLMRHADRYDLPKGHRVDGESELQCALRELREETGLTPNCVELLEGFRHDSTYYPRYRRLGGKRVKKTVSIFLGWLADDPAISITEHAGYEWIPWHPPHKTSSETIDSLLVEVEHLFRSMNV